MPHQPAAADGALRLATTPPATAGNEDGNAAAPAGLREGDAAECGAEEESITCGGYFVVSEGAFRSRAIAYVIAENQDATRHMLHAHGARYHVCLYVYPDAHALPRSARSMGRRGLHNCAIARVLPATCVPPVPVLQPDTPAAPDVTTEAVASERPTQPECGGDGDGEGTCEADSRHERRASKPDRSTHREPTRVAPTQEVSTPAGLDATAVVSERSPRPERGRNGGGEGTREAASRRERRAAQPDRGKHRGPKQAAPTQEANRAPTSASRHVPRASDAHEPACRDGTDGGASVGRGNGAHRGVQRSGAAQLEQQQPNAEGPGASAPVLSAKALGKRPVEAPSGSASGSGTATARQRPRLDGAHQARLSVGPDKSLRISSCEGNPEIPQQPPVNAPVPRTPQVGDPVLKVRLPYTERLASGDKRHEMRSKPIAQSGFGPIERGDWVWFATLKGKYPGCEGCAILGGARYVGQEGPLHMGTPGSEQRWLQLQHTVPGTLSAFATSMGRGYLTGIYAWEFADSQRLDAPVEMEDSLAQVFTAFRPRRKRVGGAEHEYARGVKKKKT